MIQYTLHSSTYIHTGAIYGKWKSSYLFHRSACSMISSERPGFSLLLIPSNIYFCRLLVLSLSAHIFTCQLYPSATHSIHIQELSMAIDRLKDTMTVAKAAAAIRQQEKNCIIIEISMESRLSNYMRKSYQNHIHICICIWSRRSEEQI